MPWTMRLVRAPEDEVWRRWKLGEAFSEIGRALGTCRQTIFQVVCSRGGVAPPQRRRRASSLRLSEREEISGAGVRSSALDDQPGDQTEQDPARLSRA
jgi:hypothetical protein